MRGRRAGLWGSGGALRSNNLYRCFCCFHVRSGALALGTWHLMIHLFALCLLAYMSANLDDINAPTTALRSSQTLTILIRRTNLSDTAAAIKPPAAADDSDDSDADEPIALPVSMHTQPQGPAAPGGLQLKDAGERDGKDTGSASIIIRGGGAKGRGDSSTGVSSFYWSSFVFNGAGQPILSQRDLNLAFLLGCITVSIALMMVVGILKGRPAYLIPFLTYQIMDLIISCLTVAGLICYGPELKDYVLSDSDFPYRDELASMDNQWVSLVVAIVVLSIVFMKAYFVQVVWLCIRYLKEEKMRRAREDCQPKVIYLDNATDPELTMFVFDDEGKVVKQKVPPPAYEAAVSGEPDQTAPPAYSA